MKTCDDYQLELEMRRHGALEPDAAEALELHLQGCERCRRAEALARSTEAAMHETATAAVRGVDWKKIQRNVEKDQRLLKALPVLMLASFAIQGPILAYVLAPDRWLRGGLLIAGMGVGAALLTWLGMRGRVARTTAAQRQGLDALLQHRREELETRIKEVRVGRWMLVAGTVPVMAIPVIKGAATGAYGAFAAIAACALGAAAYYQFVGLPKLLRERDELRR